MVVATGSDDVFEVICTGSGIPFIVSTSLLHAYVHNSLFRKQL